MDSRKPLISSRLRYWLGLSLIGGALSVGAIAESPATDAPGASAGLESEPCYADGWPQSLRCYHVPVSQEGDVQLSVLVAPAVNSGQHEPLYLLAGGPGQAASDLARLLNPLRKLNRERDIVMVDRRGGGRSDAFDCGLGADTPSSIELFTAQMAVCYIGAGQRPLTINSRQTVDDLETVRQALGHTRISLWGGSWGTRTALLYQQWYPQSLQSLVLDGVAPIDTKVFLAATAAESALQELEQACSEDLVCAGFGDWRSQLDTLLANWSDEQAGNFPDPFTGRAVEEPVETWMLAGAVRSALYDPAAAAQLPYAVTEASRGNFAPLSGILGLFADMEGAMSMGLTLSVACAEEMNRIDAGDIARDSADTFIGDMFVRIFVEGCKVWPVPARPYDTPEPRDHPILLISGTADPITPPKYADEQLAYLPNQQHLVVRGGGHINSARGCVPDLILQFLDQPDTALDDSCLADIRRPPFTAAAFGPALMPDLAIPEADSILAGGETSDEQPSPEEVAGGDQR
ncbi:alpha/beta fold hydrolase [uncultured Microbulbifer sp.]|uniref:alpha/beta fold hydrolase n=1 Tax=uncultured Microbulbifer sp. TaxID=348147 RepID=UPI0026339930|nr:alpha/beta fold hydrolase [uncultured Microbulbifer sp.]